MPESTKIIRLKFNRISIWKSTRGQPNLIDQILVIFFGSFSSIPSPGSAAANGREPKSCLGRVFSLTEGEGSVQLTS
jgi:hypothetical protein